MKNIFFSMLFFSSYLYGALGCMDNSTYTDRSKGYDYKTYHYVACVCNCDRYAQLFDRGACSKCLHFRVTEPAAWMKIK